MSEEFLIERTPVDADAHGLAVLDRHFDDGGKLFVSLILETNVAGIDAILGEGFGTGGVLSEQLVADVVEVADEGDLHAALQEAVADVRHGFGGFIAIHRDANDL
jgi:hypothetical protein